MLDLPSKARACLFDLDGVLTETAKVHAAAWKEMFDTYLKARADNSGEPFVTFDKEIDYETHVDGKMSADGTRSFANSWRRSAATTSERVSHVRSEVSLLPVNRAPTRGPSPSSHQQGLQTGLHSPIRVTSEIMS